MPYATAGHTPYLAGRNKHGIIEILSQLQHCVLVGEQTNVCQYVNYPLLRHHKTPT